MGNIGTWQLVIILAIVLLLFGAKKLPEAARGLGRSLKIFKTETEGLISSDDKSEDATPDKSAKPQEPAAQPPRAVESTPTQPQQGEVASDPTRRDA